VSFLAAMQTVPRTSTRRLGRRGLAWQQFWRISLPSIKGVVAIVTLPSTSGRSTFNIVYIMTRGGPGGGTTSLPRTPTSSA